MLMQNDFVLSHWTIFMEVGNDNYCCIQRIHNYKAKWCIQYYVIYGYRANTITKSK